MSSQTSESSETFGRRLASRMFGSDPDSAYRRRAIWIAGRLARHAQGRRIRLLDIGCGRAYYFPLYEALSIDAAGIEADPETQAIAQGRYPQAHISLGDAGKLPHDDATIDSVIMSEVLEHLPDPVQALREAARVLKPGGQLLATVPNANYPFFWDPINWTLETLTGAHIGSGVLAGIWANHLRLYDEGTLSKQLHDAGLRIVDVQRQTRHSLPFIHNLVYGFGKELAEKGFLPDIRHDPRAKSGALSAAAISVIQAVSNRIDLMNAESEPTGTPTVNLCVEATSPDRSS
jgi:2-polyprenyl-6-hydroxyphenyl methylase/3-demethylubiquinone-9 3-methyltransferase